MMKRIVLACAMIIAMQAAAFAATQPDPSANPVFASIKAAGAKFYYLGKEAGLDGWFIVKDGQVQILYATPDNKAALVGGLLGENGDDITVNQITILAANNKEVEAVINTIRKQEITASQPLAANAVSQQLASISAVTNAAVEAVTPTPSMPSAPSAAQATAPEAAAPAAAASPGERLLHDMAGATGVVIGTNPSAPQITMVMDTDCPHCQATWKLLRDLVIKGSLQLRFVPIANAESDDERSEAVLIAKTDPLEAWDKYVAGDKSKLAGTPAMASLVGIRANHLLTDSWKINKTPYLIYRAKNGKVKIVEGKPSALADILSDLGM